MIRLASAASAARARRWADAWTPARVGRCVVVMVVGKARALPAEPAFLLQTAGGLAPSPSQRGTRPPRRYLSDGKAVCLAVLPESWHSWPLLLPGQKLKAAQPPGAVGEGEGDGEGDGAVGAGERVRVRVRAKERAKERETGCTHGERATQSVCASLNPHHAGRRCLLEQQPRAPPHTSWTGVRLWRAAALAPAVGAAVDLEPPAECRTHPRHHPGQAARRLHIHRGTVL